jgi:hypothetical protein
MDLSRGGNDSITVGFAVCVFQKVDLHIQGISAGEP